jgi:hypothetical protein
MSDVLEDPSADERWQEGCDFAMTQLCKYLSVDQRDVNWDAATETLDGDVRAVIGNILRRKYGENWGPRDHALGDIVTVNETAPFFSDWRGAKLKVVCLRVDPDGKQWVSVIEGDARHRGNGVYDGETSDFDADYLTIYTPPIFECPDCSGDIAGDGHLPGCRTPSLIRADRATVTKEK